ncbi:MAG TPA: hypothetical protein VN663_22970 [Ramlibacter sp.]|nr:hypothetical protein [Ramlibacter sp.]
MRALFAAVFAFLTLLSGAADAQPTPGGSPGIVKISTVTITTPASYIDFPLSARYSYFKLEWHGLFLDAEDYPIMAFSQNGGVSFVNDLVNHDSYFGGLVAKTIKPSTSAVADGDYTANQSVIDPLPYQGVQSAVKHGMTGELTIVPGTATDLAKVSGPIRSFDLDGASVFTVTSGEISGGFNPNATVAPSFTPITTLRFLPSGTYNVNAPVGGTIVAGVFTLYGYLP